MRIGIVTQPLSANYGCLLQNYALQRVLREMGHDPVTLDYLPVTGFRRYMKSLFRRVFLRAPYRPLFPKRQPQLEAFVREHIATVPTGHRYKKSLLEKYHIEALLVGSDQVWRRSFNPRTLPDMFLAFAGSFPGPRIAYAASFGIDAWDADEKTRAKCRSLVKKFQSISVREPSGISICREELGVEAILAPDPTRLLTKADYLSLCQGVPVATEPYIAAYILDVNLNAERQLDQIALDTGFPIRRCTGGKGATLSVEQWLALFRDAEEVVTDSFHGAFFAGLFGKKSIIIENERRGRERFETLKTEASEEEIGRQGRSILEQALAITGKS